MENKAHPHTALIPRNFPFQSIITRNYSLMY